MGEGRGPAMPLVVNLQAAKLVCGTAVLSLQTLRPSCICAQNDMG